MLRNIHKRNDDILTVLGNETKFNGVLKFENFLRIDGYFEGSIQSSGFLIIQPGAEVLGDIKVNVLLVGGIIRGDVEAKERIEILSSGQIIGTVNCPKFMMAEESHFVGLCEMFANPLGIDIFEMPPERLKKSLTRVH